MAKAKFERTKPHVNIGTIGHVDHGKTTLTAAITNVLASKGLSEVKSFDTIDSAPEEKERGITIKSHAIQMEYEYMGEKYILNLIDTPGHVDFSYEVSRSIAACEGALLVVDATQGVEAQTLANVYLAVGQDLEILPVINKIDLPSARPDEIKAEIEDIIGLDASDAPLISAKNGINIEDVLEQIVEKIPSPVGDEKGPLKALIFDSVYDD